MPAALQPCVCALSRAALASSSDKPSKWDPTLLCQAGLLQQEGFLAAVRLSTRCGSTLLAAKPLLVVTNRARLQSSALRPGTCKGRTAEARVAATHLEAAGVTSGAGQTCEDFWRYEVLLWSEGEGWQRGATSRSSADSSAASMQHHLPRPVRGSAAQLNAGVHALRLNLPTRGARRTCWPLSCCTQCPRCDTGGCRSRAA